MRVVLCVLCCVLLAGCAGVNDDPRFYTQEKWSKKSFDESRARCRYDSMRYDKAVRDYAVKDNLFYACMHKQGYAYHAPAPF